VRRDRHVAPRVTVRLTITTAPKRDHDARFCAAVAEQHGDRVELHAIGGDDPAPGPPTPMAVFTRAEATR